jgi:hypothetical protein
MPRLTDPQRAELFEKGYLHLEGAFTAAETAPVRDELEATVGAAAARLAASGAIPSAHEDEGFRTRLARISEHTAAGYRAVAAGEHTGPALLDLLRSEAMMALVEPILGGEIVCQAYRVRPKLPDLPLTRGFTVVPWHQDAAYFEPVADGGLFLTVWVALTESTVENGCLQVIPFAHRRLLPHRNVRGRMHLPIPPGELPAEPPVSLTALPGDAILMLGLTPHRSLPNRTSQIRWSVDGHYHRADQPGGYPPQPGFLARSAATPEAVVATVEHLTRIRRAHVAGPAPRWSRWPTDDP